MAVVLPLTIQGLGGVGKTQVALEYAHRFKAEYDIVWWMNCGQPQYVDASLADLGQQLREIFHADVPEEGGITEVVQKVLQLLNEGPVRQRWLLIYDNAEDIDDLKAAACRPAGAMSSITSRNERWTDLGGQSIPVGVFKREESISHLRRRMPSITEDEAEQLADVLGDMPLAVAAAGALAGHRGHVRRRIPPAAGRTTDAQPCRGASAARLPASGREGLEPFPRPAEGEVRRRRPAAGDMLGHGAGHQPGPDQ